MLNGIKNKGRWTSETTDDSNQISNSKLQKATSNLSSCSLKRNLTETKILRSITTMADYEVGKKAAAIKAVENHIKSGNLVGIGSGSTIVYAVDKLAELVSKGTLTDIQCVPTSFQARQLILDNNLTLTSLESSPRLAVAIDGADEADSDLTLIKGGGGCLAQEKVVAANADLFVVIADDRKRSEELGTSWKYVPIEVLDLAYKPLQATIEAKFGGKANLRMAKAKAGPVVTDNGNLILDWTFQMAELREKMGVSPDKDLWQAVNTQLCCLAGVVDTGIFVDMAKVAYFGDAQGNVKTTSK